MSISVILPCELIIFILSVELLLRMTMNYYYYTNFFSVSSACHFMFELRRSC